MDDLAGFSRVLLFDRRGTGLSDPSPDLQSSSLSAWVDDFHAVVGAAGLGPAVLLSFDTGARMSLLVAAGRPELVTHLVLVNGQARLPTSTTRSLARLDSFASVTADDAASRWIPRVFRGARGETDDQADDPHVADQETGWAWRDSNPRHLPCKGSALAN